MDLQICPISPKEAVEFLSQRGCNFDDGCSFAISVKNVNGILGVIAMKTDKDECSLVHLYTDGTPLVGSILYGAAWRVAKALGHQQITL